MTGIVAANRGAVLSLNVQVLATDGDAVLGMSLLYGCRVTLEIVDGGVITIEEKTS